MAKILVVDGDKILAKLLDYMFSSKGHHVSVANTGRKALSMIDAEAPDLMLLDMDMMLPEIDGLEVLRTLKALESQFPVILLSATGDSAVINKAMKMGATDHCTKPFKASDLYNMVANYLATSAAPLGTLCPGLK